MFQRYWNKATATSNIAIPDRVAIQMKRDTRLEVNPAIRRVLEMLFMIYGIDPTQILSCPLAILGSGLQPGLSDTDTSLGVRVSHSAHKGGLEQSLPAPVDDCNKKNPCPERPVKLLNICWPALTKSGAFLLSGFNPYFTG
jgi:hypothetical protein